MDPAEFQDSLRRARQGDREALDNALGAVRERLRSAARRSLNGRLRQHLETSDILQTTYLDIVRGIGSFRGEDQDSFAAWVGRVLDHNVVDKLKFHGRGKRAAERTPADAEAVDRIAEDGPTPSLAAIKVEELQLVGRALERLEDAQRDAIVLRMIQQMDYPAIAEALGRSEGAVRMLIVRARAALAIHLDRMRSED